jgi:hypothetical protein
MKGHTMHGRRLHGSRRTVGSIYQVQPLGAVSDPHSPMGSFVPVVGGVLATAITTLGLRYGMQPTTKAQMSVMRYAPYIGIGVGELVAMIFGYSTGKASGMAAGSAAAITGLVMVTSDYFGGKKLSELSASRTSASITDAMAPYGLGAIVAEYGSQPGRPRQLGNGNAGGQLGEIVWQKQNTRGVGAYGDQVTLRGVTQSAYGTPGFSISR